MIFYHSETRSKQKFCTWFEARFASQNYLITHSVIPGPLNPESCAKLGFPPDLSTQRGCYIKEAIPLRYLPLSSPDQDLPRFVLFEGMGKLKDLKLIYDEKSQRYFGVHPTIRDGSLDWCISRDLHPVFSTELFVVDQDGDFPLYQNESFKGTIILIPTSEKEVFKVIEQVG